LPAGTAPVRGGIVVKGPAFDDDIEGWIHAVATANPVTRVLESGRGFVAGAPTEVGIAYGAALALAVGFSVWAWRGLRKAEAAG